MAKRGEPRWLSRFVVDTIHGDQILEHGGFPGVRDHNALESTLGRPHHKWLYDNERDWAALTAAYGFGLVRNHPYRDGNKRTGFLSMGTFLHINGFDLNATDADIVTLMVQLAAGDISESQLAGWIRVRLVKT